MYLDFLCICEAKNTLKLIQLLYAILKYIMFLFKQTNHLVTVNKTTFDSKWKQTVLSAKNTTVKPSADTEGKNQFMSAHIKLKLCH